MGSWRVDIRPRLSRNSVSFTSSKKNETVLGISYNILRLAFNENSIVLVFSNNQGNFAIFILEKIEKFFIVNLQERAINSEVVWIKLAFSAHQVVENMINGSRN